MGRRPDPLVSEFFERGEKIGNSSNRYQHSCKRCGEVFPKGRVESLIGHLLRRCPNVTPEDRDLVVAQYAQKPEQQSVSGKKRRRSNEVPFDVSRQEARQDHSALPIHGDSQKSALDTLAEVSRRHLDYSSHRSLPVQTQQSELQAFGQLIAEQALIEELQQHNQSFDHAGTAQEDFGLDVSTDASVTARGNNSSGVPAQTSGLMQTASAANRALEYAQSRTHAQPDSTLDPQLQEVPEAVPQPEHEQLGGEKRGETIVDQGTAAPTRTAGADVSQAFEEPSLPGREPTPGFGILQRPSKSKTRSKFNDERRKEIHGIRKQGACMRCRMLKKPCSEGTPCNSCRNIETARVWKGTCTRSRLSEECTLWSAHLFRSHRDAAMLSTGAGRTPVTLPGHLEVRFSAISELRMALPGQVLSLNPSLDPGLHGGPNEDHGMLQQVLLSNDDDKMQEELELYVTQITDHYIDTIISPFMKATLQQAKVHIGNIEATSIPAAIMNEEHPKRRSGYNLQSQLLGNTIKLWILNGILTSPDQRSLQLRHTSTSDAQHPSSMNEQGDREALDATTILNERGTLARAQILASIESRCNTLSKAVMNELERRLLRRKQVSRFATFLSAVILLNCVERMSGFYRSMKEPDAADNSHEPGSASDPEYNAQTPASPPSADPEQTSQPNGTQMAPSSWLLQHPPAQLWHQGSHFADLLTTLLHIRALPPSVTKTSSDTLAVLREDLRLTLRATAGRSIISSRTDCEDQPSREAAEWLDPLELRIADLLAIRDGETPTPDMGAKAWDLRFISRLLLPGSM